MASFEADSSLRKPSSSPVPAEADSGAGYGGDPDWSHGRWMGRGWSQASVYDLTDPAVAGRIPFGVIDHLARARFAGEEGWGLLEHASVGRHDPTGFADWSSVAP